MASVYCGIADVPKDQHRGSMRECAEKKQIRYYGIKKVDKRTLDAVENKKNVPETRENLIRALAKEKGNINRYKGRFEHPPKHISQEKIEEYYKLWKKAEKRFNKLAKKFQELEKKRKQQNNKSKSKSKSK